jgi:hypothetical protein
MRIESLNAIGPEGQLVGLALGRDGQHLVVALPSTLNAGRAAVELS